MATILSSFSKNYSSNDTVDGGRGDDLLSYDTDYEAKGITSTFNPATNIGSITLGTNRISYKNIERLNITGTSNDDLIVGNNGNDTLSGGISGNDTVDGGKGDDLLVYYSGATEGITSTFNAITNTGLITVGTRRFSYKNIERLNITGTEYDDLIVGNNGDDTIDGGSSGNDTVDGGKGDDLLVYINYGFSEGITSTFNATTNTGLITDGTRQINYKNIERLNITGTGYDDLIIGNNGNDTITPGSGNDTVDGGLGDDLLVYGSGPTQGITWTFDATTNTGLITNGTSRISYKNIERLEVTLTGTYNDDLIVGSNGNDTIIGNITFTVGSGRGGYEDFGAIAGNDTIDGGAGEDLLIVNDNGDSEGKGIISTFNATTNTGTITAGTNQVSYKNIERLEITGTQYDDNILGSNGNDTLNGGSGNDILIGGKGNDTLIGGYGGTDTFAFNSFNEGVDSINDFNATTTNELIQVSAAGFGGGLSSGSLSANQFTLGASATTNQERFIYNTATGGLFFDLDGSASGFTQVKFAQLSAGLSVSKNNFVVV